MTSSVLTNAIPPKVAVLVLNWNGGARTIACLKALFQQDYPNFLAVLVDNGSRDGSPGMIVRWARESLGPAGTLVEYPEETAARGGDDADEDALGHAPSRERFVMITNRDNLGFDAGYNVGLDYVLRSPRPADFAFLLNNDALVEKNCLSRLVAASLEHDIGLLGAVIKDRRTGDIQFARSGPFRRHLYITLTHRQSVPEGKADFWASPIVSAAAMMLRADVLKAVRSHRGFYLNPDLFMYHDELDFCHAASQAGFSAGVVRDAIVYHANEERPDLDRYSLIFHYYFTRNAVFLAKRILPAWQKRMFYVLDFLLNARRKAKFVLSGSAPAARAIRLGAKDGLKEVMGKWKLHDDILSGKGFYEGRPHRKR